MEKKRAIDKKERESDREIKKSKRGEMREGGRERPIESE